MLRPPEKLTVSQWADQHRYLSRRFTKEPGMWRTSKTPYLREPLDAIADPDVSEIVFMKCSRIGGTEFLNNAIAYTIDADPKPIMYVQPTSNDVQDEFQGRLKAMIEDSERLRQHIPDNANWANQHKISVNTLDIYGAWPTNPQTMIRKTIGFLGVDEIDNAEAQVTRLGNFLQLLRERLVTYEERGKLVAPGTPTNENAAGWVLLKQSDYRRYHVPCPLCGGYQVLGFDDLEIVPGLDDEKPSPDRIEFEQLARYRCQSCKELLRWDQHQRWMIDRGVWIPRGIEIIEPLPLDDDEIANRRSLTVQRDGGEQWVPATQGNPPAVRTRGYWIDVLNSPFTSRTWSHTLARWFRVYDKPEERRVFVNSWRALPYREAVDVPEWQELSEKCKHEHEVNRVPSDVKFLTMGVDVQKDVIHYSIWGFAQYGTTYLIREGTELTYDRVYEIAFYTYYPITDAIGPIEDTGALPQMRCAGIGIDAGYPGRRDEVDDFGKRPGVTPLFGRSTQTFNRFRGTQTDPFHRTKSKRTPDALIVNTVLYKSKIMRMLKMSAEQDGAIRLHRNTAEDFLKQLVAEIPSWETIKTGKRKGRKELLFRPRVDGAPNHGLDTTVYSIMLGEAKGSALLRENSPKREVVYSQTQDAPVHRVAEKKKKPESRRGEMPRGYLG